MSTAAATVYPHVTIDDAGVARVAGTRLKVIHLVQAKQAWNLLPEDLVEHFPPLTLAGAHSALAYYYDHQVELDAKIARDREYAERMRQMLDDAAWRARIKSLRSSSERF